ncbi:MAG TPA: AMP-binding protein [Frankiaceae bacterium]|nr:AMP-binding protein [Frankiaceae bacterium]
MRSPVEDALAARTDPWLRENGRVLSGRDVVRAAGGAGGALRLVPCDGVAAALGAVVAATRAGAVALLWPGRAPVPEWLARAVADPPPLPGRALVGVASSGTTGSGKVVLLDQARALANAAAIRDRLGDTLPGATVASLRSAAYAAGFVGDLLATLLADGATYVPPPVAAPALAARALRGAGVTAVHASTAVAGTVALPEGVRHVVLSGDRLDPRVVAALRARGATVWSGYGLAEAGPRVTLGRCPDDVVAGWAGAPLPGVSVTAEREVAVRTPYAAAGVLDAGGYREIPDAPVATGDGGRLDSGALVVAGRLAGSLTTGGVTVFGEEVETALAARGIVATVALRDGRCHVRVTQGTAAEARSVLRRSFPLLPSVEVVTADAPALTLAGKVRR